MGHLLPTIENSKKGENKTGFNRHKGVSEFKFGVHSPKVAIPLDGNKEKK